jgi:hypothetical protein
MFAYDYLKENPQVRDKLFKEEWSTLFLDPDLPFNVKKELEEVQRITSQPTDAVLFFYKRYLMFRILNEGEVVFVNSFKSHWAEQLYLEWLNADTKDKDRIADKSMHFLCSISAEDYLCKIHLRSDEIHTLVHRCFLNREASTQRLIVSALIPSSIDQAWLLTAKQAGLLLERCTVRLIRTLVSQYQLNEVSQLIEDTDEGIIFNSINEIHKAHDARIVRETESLIKKHGGKSYKYSKELAHIAEKCGFFLPTGPTALVERGRKHNNCVGTYESKHISAQVPARDSRNGAVMERLFFDVDATLHLNIVISHHRIVSTEVQQYKGKNNKDKERQENLTELRCALVGHSPDILRVEVINNDNDNEKS